MSHMNEIIQKDTDFTNIYNKSRRLAAAVFMISNIIDQSEELKTKIKNLSLKLVSMSVNLKDINLSEAGKLTAEIEKNSLELMSMLDIACISGLISKMNGNILKEEFQSFILELGKFSEGFENNKNASVKSIFMESSVADIDNSLERTYSVEKIKTINVYKNSAENREKNGNGQKRKLLRRSTIFDFIKGHNNVSIKDIVPNIIGCSEKTVQRELIELISGGKIKKIGERRWSRYSIT